MTSTIMRGLSLRIWEGRFVGVRPQMLPAASLPCNFRIFSEAARTLRRGANIPRKEYERGKIDEYKLEIQKILDTLNAPTSSSPKGSDAASDERVTQSLLTDFRDITTTTSGSEIGKTCPCLTDPVLNDRRYLILPSQQ